MQGCKMSVKTDSSERVIREHGELIEALMAKCSIKKMSIGEV